MSLPASIISQRRSRCRYCPAPCADFQANAIALDDPVYQCPVGRWPGSQNAGSGSASSTRFGKASLTTTIGHTFQPGDLLSLCIQKLTGVAPCQACLDFKARMNEWGWWGCWLHRDEVIERLCQEAAKRGHKIDAPSATAILKSAWRELRQHH